MHILFEDNHVIVVEKEANIPTQAPPEGGPSLEEEVKKHLPTRFLHPIHRLDSPVSGLVLFAKTQKALSRLNEAMRNGDIERIYVAQVEGSLKGSGTLVHYLKKGSFRTEIVKAETEGAQRAVLHYIVRDKGVEIKLETGRYHQIRAQFAAIGHPILGDQKYGAKALSAIRLSCYQLTFPHPTKGISVTVSCQPFFAHLD